MIIIFNFCNICCSNYYLQITDPFVQIENCTHLTIYFILQYQSQRGVKTKQSPPFGNGSNKKLSFPRTAQNIAFNVLNHSTGAFICNHTLPSAGFYYFNVIETPQGIICVQN